jgi:Ice-binding-like
MCELYKSYFSLCKNTTFKYSHLCVVKIISQLNSLFMKLNLSIIASSIALFFSPIFNFAQAPNLGSVANYVLFSTNGAVSNVGFSLITGNVGANTGAVSGFGNVDGGMHNIDGSSAAAVTDLLNLYNEINAKTPTANHAVQLGEETLNAGIYALAGATNLNGNLTLDGQGDPNALFIFKVSGGTFTSSANSQVILINGAVACNVFWVIEGAINIGAGTMMKGNIIANNAAIDLNAGVNLEGRALSTTGAIVVNGVVAVMPLGCGIPILTGPMAPTLGLTSCFALFSSNGSVTNAGTTLVSGDIGTNSGMTSGFNAANVTGIVHPTPNATTVTTASNLTSVQSYISTLPTDIELLYPAQFGNTLVLTPHTYLMSGIASFNSILYLNAQGNADAVFVFKITGPLAVSTNASIVLQNGAQAKNVYWKVDGAVPIASNVIFKGNIINSGAISIGTLATIEGRALTSNGAITTADINVTLPSACENALPVTWLYLKAKAIQNDVLVEWGTTDELNNDYFVVEKSKNGKDFQAIAQITSVGELVKGQYHYAYTDKQPYGITYYRISQTDKNSQKKKYTPIVLVSLNQDFKVNQYVQENFIFVETSGAEVSTGSIELYDISGRLMFSQKINLNKDDSMFKIDKPQQSGLYLLYIGRQGEKSYLGKVMVF